MVRRLAKTTETTACLPSPTVPPCSLLSINRLKPLWKLYLLRHTNTSHLGDCTLGSSFHAPIKCLLTILKPYSGTNTYKFSHLAVHASILPCCIFPYKTNHHETKRVSPKEIRIFASQGRDFLAHYCTLETQAQAFKIHLFNEEKDKGVSGKIN